MQGFHALSIAKVERLQPTAREKQLRKKSGLHLEARCCRPDWSHYVQSKSVPIASQARWILCAVLTVDLWSFCVMAALLPSTGQSCSTSHMCGRLEKSFFQSSYLKYGTCNSSFIVHLYSNDLNCWMNFVTLTTCCLS